MLNRRVLNLALLTVVLTGCAAVPAPVSVADTISHNPSLSTFSSLITQASLSATLQGPGPFTVFAPSNDAFKLLPATTMDELTKHPEKLRNILAFHIVPVKLIATEVKNSSVKTLNGANIALSKAGDFVTVEEAMVEQKDIQASNGLIHIIDGVLTPPIKK